MHYFGVVVVSCTILLTCELLVAHPVENQVQNPSVENARSQRHIDEQENLDDAVDFGAHTGDNGAFGWYAQYPVE